jgi:serine/threonine-protein kinase
MYATVNSAPPPPSSRNRLVPAMLDLIVAKAMAKVVDDRYQTIKEFGDDLREVRRQLDASRPSIALKATTAPPPAPPGARDLLASLDAQTTPLKADGRLARGPMSEEESAKALALAKTFDSFDATLRLASMTNQTDEFEEYITATQKMRAYRGKIEAHSPLAALGNPTFDEPTNEEPPRKSASREKASGEIASSVSNLPALVVIAVLAVVAIALLVALVAK